MRYLPRVCFLLCLWMLPQTGASSLQPMPPFPALRTATPRVIVLSWDGTPVWLVNKLLAENKLPNLADLRDRGVQAEYSVSNFPDPSTPCGHATLWTGAPSSVHGITGFFMPALPPEEHTILDKQSGFNSYLLKAEPMWIPFLRAGKRVTLVHAAQQYPFTAYTTGRRFGDNFQQLLTVLDGFGSNTLQSNHPELVPEYLQRVGEFIGKDAKLAYQQGKFGKPITEGGDGSAEEAYLESVQRVADHFRKATVFGMRFTDWNLLVCYTPFPDSVLHSWAGLLDPISPAYNAEWAAKLWPYMERVMRLCDDHLGAILFNAPSNTTIALVSDHGMIGIAKKVYINTALREANLMALDEKGQVDLSKTKVIFPPGGNTCLRINWTRYQQGIVQPQERNELVAKTTQVLLTIKDPETGRPVVTGVLDGALVGPSLGFGDERTGDLMVTLADGYVLDDDVDKQEIVVRQDPLHSGAHPFYPDHPSCRTILFVAGPGIAHGKVIPPVHHTDIAPTLCKLADVPPPAQATGKAIREVLGDNGPLTFKEGRHVSLCCH